MGVAVVVSESGGEAETTTRILRENVFVRACVCVGVSVCGRGRRKTRWRQEKGTFDHACSAGSRNKRADQGSKRDINHIIVIKTGEMPEDMISKQEETLTFYGYVPLPAAHPKCPLLLPTLESPFPQVVNHSLS